MERCSLLLVAVLILVGPGAALLLAYPFAARTRFNPYERRVARLTVFVAALAALILGSLAVAGNC